MFKKAIKNKHSYSAIGQIGSSGIAIISLVILARTLSQEMFGQWGLFLALLSFVDIVKRGLVGTSLVKYASGESKLEKEILLGSSWVLNILSSLILAVLFYSAYLSGFFVDDSITLFLLFYPIYSLVSMPYHYKIWHSEIDVKMGTMAFFKILNVTFFLIVCIVNIYITLSLFSIVAFYVASFGVSSVISILSGSTGLINIKVFTKSKLWQLIDFGRYNMLSNLGSNLLRSSDTFLISAFLGNEALAIYIIPQRLWMIVATPILSAMTVAFPIFSSNHNQNLSRELKQNIEKYIGVLTLLYIPFAISLFFLAPPLVLLVGGEDYYASIAVFRIFLVYSIIVPFDQIMGVSLDAVNRPKNNFFKVSIMAIVNIVGDVIVLILFEDIRIVAWVTLATTIAGALAGYFMLKPSVDIKITDSLRTGFKVLSSLFFNFLSKTKSFYR